MSPKLTFTWSNTTEEAVMSKKDLAALKLESWILQLDFLQDVMREAETAYHDIWRKGEAEFIAKRMKLAVRTYGKTKEKKGSKA